MRASRLAVLALGLAFYGGGFGVGAGITGSPARAGITARAARAGITGSPARAGIAGPPARAAKKPILERDVPTGAPAPLRIRAAARQRVTYHGGRVLHSSRGHVIFWEPSGSGLTFDAGYEALIERFLGRVAAASHSTTNVYGLSGQYHDFDGPAAYASTYGGAVVAADPLPDNQCHEPSTGPPSWKVCLTDAQLQSEIDHVVAADRLPHGATDIYFLVLPNGFGTCLESNSRSCALGGANNGYCGYHLETGTGILDAVIPYNAIPGHCQSANPRPNHSTADPALSTLAHEQTELITDPDDDAWSDVHSDEIADLCLQHFGRNVGGAGGTAWNEVIDGGHYYLQELWSNDDRGCAARAARDRVSFPAPRRVRAGTRVSFAGRASDPHGSIAGYLWFFATGAGGGGRAGVGAGAGAGGGAIGSRRPRATHVFARPGIYRVVLRVTDSAGNWAFATRVIRVTRH